MIILGIDPGLATGVSLTDWSDPLNPSKIDSWEVDFDGFYGLIPKIIRENSEKEFIIVCENFIITVETAKKSPAPWSLELIGLTRYLARQADVSLVLQNPSEREIATHEMIKTFGMWHVGGEGHANQAFRHTFSFMLNSSGAFAKKVLSLL